MWSRGIAALLVVLFVIPAHLVATLFGHKHLVPPLFLGLMGRVAGLRIRVTGRAHKGALLLSNHESWLDILALAQVARSIFVAHAGLAGHPVLKWLCDQNETVFITRDMRGTVARQVEQVRAALGTRPVTIFPEATTGDGIELLPFRSSLLSAVEALAGDIPIQPVALDYADAGETGWYGDEPGLENVRRILSRREPVDLTIHFLEPLSGPDLADRKAMAAAARRIIAERLRR